MLTDNQLDWLEYFARYNKNDDYFSDRIYVEAIYTLLEAHFQKDLFSNELNIAVENELKRVYEYINGKYEQYEEKREISVLKWRRKK